MAASKKTSDKLPPLVEVNPNAQVEKVVTVNKKDPLLVDLKVTNPIVYLKAWWKKVIANEGIDFRFRIRPLTALAITGVIMVGSFGLGRILIPEPLVRYIPSLVPSPSPNPWRETAFTGVLKYTEANKRYYLVTNDSEAITLEVPSTVNASRLIGKRILAIGKINSVTKILKVTDASDLEILPAQVVPVPTTLPTPTPTFSPASPSAQTE